MKTKGLYIIIACLATILLILGTVLIMKYQSGEDSNHAANLNTQHQTSTFGIDGLDESQTDINSQVTVVDTVLLEQLNDVPKTRNVEKNTKPSLVISYAELFPNDVSSNVNAIHVNGKILRVDEESEGIYIIDKQGVSSYVNFDFSNLTEEKKGLIRDYMQVGRRISTVCTEEGRTLVVNSFKIW